MAIGFPNSSGLNEFDFGVAKCKGIDSWGSIFPKWIIKLLVDESYFN
jgi:hypothetical protein